MNDSINLPERLALWVNVAHKLWEAKSRLLPVTEKHDPSIERPVFTQEIMATYDGLNTLFLEAEKNKREILALMVAKSEDHCKNV